MNRKLYISVLGESSDELSVLFSVSKGYVLGALFIIIYINDIYNSTDLRNFVLFADDTDISVADKRKFQVFEKANEVLKSITDYMEYNLWHIKKCCYMQWRNEFEWRLTA